MSTDKIAVRQKDGSKNLLAALKQAAEDSRAEAHKHSYWAIRGVNLHRDGPTSRELALQHIAIERFIDHLSAALSGEWEDNNCDPYLDIKGLLEP